jgi:hypothetical protein
MGGRPRIAGLRVVMSWPDSEFAPEPLPRGRGRGRLRLTGLTGVCLVIGGVIAMLVAALAQQHAPAPSASAAGNIGPGAKGPSLHQSLPVAVTIPTIGVQSRLLHLGRNKDGAMEVPDLTTSAREAAWYRYSVTPGQIGTAVIEGHVDSYQGPAVFFRLGALRPGNRINVTLADGITAVFRVTGVREYAKDKYPANTIYAPANYAALRLITCGGDFDAATGRYLSSVVVFASLASSSHK